MLGFISMFQMDFIIQVHLKSKSMSMSKNMLFLDVAISPKCHEVTTGGIPVVFLTPRRLLQASRT